MTTEPGAPDDSRQLFRVFIDYVEAFDPARRHAGLLLWRPGLLHSQRGRNYTSLVMHLLRAGQCELGVLPDRQANEWTSEAVDSVAKLFHAAFQVTDGNRHDLLGDPSGLTAEQQVCLGTASLTLRHRQFGQYTLRLRFLKKAIRALPTNAIYLVDDEGHSVSVSASKRIRVFTFDLLTNTVAMVPWWQCLAGRKRKRPKPERSEEEENEAQ